MPELPEIQALAERLDASLAGRRVAGISGLLGGSLRMGPQGGDIRREDGTMDRQPTAGGDMANKDKGGKSAKKAAAHDLKEKRAAKKSKKAEKAKNAKSSE